MDSRWNRETRVGQQEEKKENNTYTQHSEWIQQLSSTELSWVSGLVRVAIETTPQINYEIELNTAELFGRTEEKKTHRTTYDNIHEYICTIA